ncbi:MAG: hypothetical protein ABIO05_06395 [Ferruginibacter sp.]
MATSLVLYAYCFRTFPFVYAIHSTKVRARELDKNNNGMPAYPRYIQCLKKIQGAPAEFQEIKKAT